MKARKTIGILLSVALLLILRSQAAETLFAALNGINIYQDQSCPMLDGAVFSQSGDYTYDIDIGAAKITVPIKVKDTKTLVAGGECIGIALYTRGVMVVGSQEIVGKDRSVRHPALDAGIKAGDLITEVNGTRVKSITEFVLHSEKNITKPIALTVERNGQAFTANITAAYDLDDQKYRLGLWLKDSTAGIGTLTYYDKSTMTFGALGHAVCESETGLIMPLDRGEIVKCTINDVKKGQCGRPGELRGSFRADAETLGVIAANTERGLFGVLTKELANKTQLPIASHHSVKTGKASILTTINDKVECYEIQIVKLNQNQVRSQKGLVIQVTDRRLLEKTGGIVQGMSGSPIIQDGKLVGAVTHVLVNDPTRGYGIFIESMLDAS